MQAVLEIQWLLLDKSINRDLDVRNEFFLFFFKNIKKEI